MAQGHAELMDKIYSWQTGIYDLTRRYFLFGRDALLDRLKPAPDDRILEVGCGTCRNLRKLARRTSEAKLYGLDVSQVMLDHAQKLLDAEGAGDRVKLVQAYGEAFSHKETFGEDEGFSKMFCSYSISMIPTWRETLENCRENLAPGGELWIVDFYDQAGWPGFFQAGLGWWLKQFHVSYNPDFLPFLETMAHKSGDAFTVEDGMGRYYFLACYRRAK